MGKKTTQMVETMTFEFNEEETAAAKKFCTEHLKHVRHMSAGEAFQFIITPTMLGNMIAVYCLSCGQTQDVTYINKV